MAVRLLTQPKDCICVIPYQHTACHMENTSNRQRNEIGRLRSNLSAIPNSKFLIHLREVGNAILKNRLELGAVHILIQIAS